MATPAWAPTLEQVAVHIPTRTRQVGADDYSGDYALTFTNDTTPNAAEAQIQVEQACVKVASKVGSPVDQKAEDACRVAASWWAAYYIELAYPERDADLRVYEQLREQAEAFTADAASLNEAAGGGTELDPDPGASLLPLYSFPPAPAWADATFW